MIIIYISLSSTIYIVFYILYALVRRFGCTAIRFFRFPIVHWVNNLLFLWWWQHANDFQSQRHGRDIGRETISQMEEENKFLEVGNNYTIVLKWKFQYLGVTPCKHFQKTILQDRLFQHLTVFATTMELMEGNWSLKWTLIGWEERLYWIDGGKLSFRWMYVFFIYSVEACGGAKTLNVSGHNRT